MGLGKSVIAAFILTLLAIGLVTAFSITQSDQSRDPFYNSSANTTANRTIIATDMVTGGTISMFPGLIMISAILMFMGFLVYLKNR